MNGGLRGPSRTIVKRDGGPAVMTSSRASRLALSVVTVLAGMVTIVGTAPGSAAPAGAAPLPPKRVGLAPSSSSARDVRLGGLPGKTVLHVDVELSPRDPAGLASFATAVSTPGNALYRHYLPRGQFASRFGPTADAVTTVTNELRAAGLTVGAISSNHQTIHVTASAARLAKAFSTSFETYRLPTGRIAFANTAAPLFSGSAAPYVQGVIGLDNLSVPQPIAPERPQPAPNQSPLALQRTQPLLAAQQTTGGPQPCAAAVSFAASYTANGFSPPYTADQLASAYNFPSLYGQGDEGAGITVALVEVDSYLTSDISAYQACYGTNTTVNYTPIDGGYPNAQGDGEAALDIEDVIGLAPAATIDVYSGPNLIDDYTAIVDDDTAQVVSTSNGICEQRSPILAAEAPLFEQAAAQGQSLFAASGDNGSGDLCSGKNVDDPASQPYVTGVGGTSTTTTTAPPAAVASPNSMGCRATSQRRRPRSTS
jgi:subtilase family serine protease